MAYYNSGELAPGDSFYLGQYTFSVRSNYDSDEGITGVVGRCEYGGELSVKGIDIEGRAEIGSWYLEANSTEASIYADVKARYRPTGGIESTGEMQVVNHQGTQINYLRISRAGVMFTGVMCGTDMYIVAASEGAPFLGQSFASDIGLEQTYYSSARDYKGTTIQAVRSVAWSSPPPTPDIPVKTAPSLDDVMDVGLSVIMEQSGIESYLVARFAIDLQEAGGGVGDIGGGWDEPGDDGDPEFRLDVTISGSLSGRNSEPLERFAGNPYSFHPSDQDSVPGYGCGGDGGHGGGGGAGGATVLVKDFATSKAGSKQVKAYAKRRGYGSGGGKGGKGGDGCIIIFY